MIGRVISLMVTHWFLIVRIIDNIHWILSIFEPASTRLLHNYISDVPLLL